MGFLRSCLAAAVLIVGATTDARAYSVLAHESLVDEVWTDQLAPMLRQRFPDATPDEIRLARAYAYGGALIQDLGYYPFGSRFFSNLVHYVCSGDFVEALIDDARTVDDYAFALGALAHYASDTVAHPGAVNKALPMLFPKLRAKYGDEVLYVDSPARHVMAEFAFDVLQVARGVFRSDAYQELIGFEVATPALDRAFKATYGLRLADVFGDVDLAIGTYRHVASRLIPDITRVAWREKRDEILARAPDATERDIVYTMTRQQYESTYGTRYRKPSLLARFAVAIFKVIPTFGKFKPLAFEPLSGDSERIFLNSFAASRERYRQLLYAQRRGQLSLSDADLDTGQPPERGVNELADETYQDLLDKLKKGKTAATPALQRALDEYYTATNRSVGRYAQ